MSPDVPNAIELTQLNTTERKRGVAWTIKKQTEQPPKTVSHALTSSNA